MIALLCASCAQEVIKKFIYTCIDRLPHLIFCMIVLYAVGSREESSLCDGTVFYHHQQQNYHSVYNMRILMHKVQKY